MRWNEWQREGRYRDEWGAPRTIRLSSGGNGPPRGFAADRQGFHRLLWRAFRSPAWSETTAFVLGLYDSLTRQVVSARARAGWRDPAARRYFVELVEPVLRRAFDGGSIRFDRAPAVDTPEQAPDTEPAPPLPPPEEETHWFEVQLVDEVGAGIEGALLQFSGGVPPVRTDADGFVRIDGEPRSMLDVRIASVDDVQALLEDRWRTPRPRKVPQGELVRTSSIETAGESWSVLHSRSYVWALLPPGHEAIFVELEDALFRTDSAVPMPSLAAPSDQGAGSTPLVLALALALRFNDEHQPKKMLVAGHTDAAGSDEHNERVSRERAECVHSLLEGARDRFAELADARHTIADKKHWLTWVSSEFSEHFDCAPARIDDSIRSLSSHVTQFQAAYNDARERLEAPGGEPLDADGDLGPLTWKALFDVFEAALRRELGEPADGVAALRGELTPLASDLAFVGFGEKCPVDAAHRGKYRSQANRRVELIFFDPSEEPNLDVLRSDPASSELYEPGRYVRTPLAQASAKRATTRIALIDCRGNPMRGVRVCVSFDGGPPRVRTADDAGVVAIKSRGAKLKVWIADEPRHLCRADGVADYQGDPIVDFRDVPESVNAHAREHPDPTRGAVDTLIAHTDDSNLLAGSGWIYDETAEA